MIENDVIVNGAVSQLRYRIIFWGAVPILSFLRIHRSTAKSEDALSADEKILTVIIVLDVGLRNFLSKAICEKPTQETVPWHNNRRSRGRPRRSRVNNSSTTQLAQNFFKDVDGMSLNCLQLQPHKQ